MHKPSECTGKYSLYFVSNPSRFHDVVTLDWRWKRYLR